MGYRAADRLCTTTIICDLPATVFPAMVAGQSRWQGPLSALGRNPALHLPMLHKAG